MSMPNVTAQRLKRVTGINLVGDLSAQAVRAARVQGIARRTSFVVLGVYLVLFLGVVGTNFFFLSSEKKLQEQGAILRREITALSPVETLFETVKSRATSASGILTNSPQAPGELLSEVIALMPPGANISEITAQEGKFSVSVVLRDSVSVVDFFRSVTQSQFSNIELDGLSLGTGGVYTVSLNVR